MVATPYSGAATRRANYAMRPSVPGVNGDHFKPDPEPDPFNPQPATPDGQAGTVLAQDQPFHSGFSEPTLATDPRSQTHWYNGVAPMPSGVPTAARMQGQADGMLVDHADTNFVPDQYRLYQHATEGSLTEWIVGRPSQFAGATVPDGPLAGLANGANAYDQTNEANEVYSNGDPANVGRYRLGTALQVFGLYQNPIGKFGQDALLRPTTGLSPQFPTEKPQMRGTAPYTPNSTGTAHWAPAPPNQTPSMWGLPSETAMTDYAASSATDYMGGNSEFDDGGRL